VEIIGNSKIWTYSGQETEAIRGNCTSVRKSDGHPVSSYMELATKVAELQFKNREFVLLFRGQDKDYKNRANNTTLKPTILRSRDPGKVPGPGVLAARYAHLKRAESELITQYAARNLPGLTRLRRQPILRWSILQHYRVCGTPLMDVTHSLRIAASFGSGPARQAFIYVLGVPHISGAITASAEAGLQIVRLASVCPPSAVRPHIQEGYLLGEYPDLGGVDQKQEYPHYEVDFGRRLIAKFKFDPAGFWYNSDYFPRVRANALYPGADLDPLCELAQAIEAAIGSPPV